MCIYMYLCIQFTHNNKEQVINKSGGYRMNTCLGVEPCKNYYLSLYHFHPCYLFLVMLIQPFSSTDYFITGSSWYSGIYNLSSHSFIKFSKPQVNKLWYRHIRPDREIEIYICVYIDACVCMCVQKDTLISISIIKI